MNLIGDKWIPVVFQNIKTGSVSLEELYEKAADIRDLVLNPPQRISVMRLLICITQTALNGPENKDDWFACRGRIVPESIRYLSTRRDKFDLFGDQPFLQIKNLEPIDNATLDKLDFGLASGNNPTLFDQDATAKGRQHDYRWIAVMLLTYQCFSPGGRIGVSSWRGVKTGTGSSEHAPALEGSPMHLIVRGRNLLETIYHNLLTKDQVKLLPNCEWGIPLWDTFLTSQQGKDAKELTHSYLGRLVPLSRFIQIKPESTYCTLVNGLSYPKLPAGREPMATVVPKGKSSNQRYGYLTIDLSRHVWRELGSLLNLDRMGEAGGALALDNLKNSDDQTIDIWVGGLVADRGKLLDVTEWNFTLPLRLLFETQIAKYQKGVVKATQGEQSLVAAITEYGKYLKIEAKTLIGLKTKAKTTYWTTLDAHYQKLIEIACVPHAGFDEWKEILTKAMFESYRQTCPHRMPRQIQAFAKGHGRLRIKDNQ